MRFLEISILMMLTFLGVLIFFKKTKTKLFNSGSFFIVILLLLHIIIEKYRWQMIPSYTLSGFVILLSIINILPKANLSTDRNFAARFIWILIYFVWLGGAAILPYVLPVIKLPEPSGLYKIGTKYLILTDNNRREIFALDTTLKRELPIQVWYPAIPPKKAKPEPYLSDAKTISKIFARSQGIPFFPFILEHLNLVKTHSYPDAKIISTDKKFPIIVFSHGLMQFYRFNTSLMEELASNGYVVFSISHPYDTPCAIYPDQSIKIYGKKINVEIGDKTHDGTTDQKLKLVYEKIQNTETLNGQRELYREFYSLQPKWWNLSNDVWLQDTRFFIDKLDSLNNEHFSKELNLNNIGVMGFSFGGGTAGLAAMTDERVKAGVNLDGWQPGHILEKNINRPFIYISGKGHEKAFNFFFNNADTIVYSLNINEFKHPNFNDISLIAEIPGKLVGLTGKIDAKYGLQLIKKYSLAFFNKYLKNIDTELFNAHSNDYPELRLKVNRSNE